MNRQERGSDGVTYISFIRFFASLNNECGTFFSQIAFLPYLKANLGVDRIIFLPNSKIGTVQRKGERGSPFAVKDPFSFDEDLAEARLTRYSPMDQYLALIAACELLDIETGSIVPLATLAIDSPLFRQFPALGYWWTNGPGVLLFPSQLSSLSRISNRSKSSQQLFALPPNAEEIADACIESEAWLTTLDGGKSLVNALPDPVVGDPTKYTWSDVASVRYSVEHVPPSQGTLQNLVWDYELPAFHIMPSIIDWS